MTPFSMFTPDMEISSIDKAFLNLVGLQENVRGYAAHIRETVRKWTGIPVSIGVGPTKTLAKAANKLAKKRPEFEGVLDLMHRPDKDTLLASLDVEDVWASGIATPSG